MGSKKNYKKINQDTAITKMPVTTNKTAQQSQTKKLMLDAACRHQSHCNPKLLKLGAVPQCQTTGRDSSIGRPLRRWINLPTSRQPMNKSMLISQPKHSLFGLISRSLRPILLSKPGIACSRETRIVVWLSLVTACQAVIGWLCSTAAERHAMQICTHHFAVHLIISSYLDRLKFHYSELKTE